MSKKKECVWDHDDEWDDFYETECKKAFTLNDGTLKSNEMKYCPFCGGIIKES